MPATVQLNTRIDPDLKRRGDVVFARAGLTASEVVRAVWQAAAETQQVPECVAAHTGDADERARRLRAVEEGAGLAVRVAEEMGFHFKGTFDPCDYKRLRDEMYDEIAAEMMGHGYA